MTSGHTEDGQSNATYKLNSDGSATRLGSCDLQKTAVTTPLAEVEPEGENKGLELASKINDAVGVSTDLTVNGTIGAQKLANAASGTSSEIVNLGEKTLMKGVTVEVAGTPRGEFVLNLKAKYMFSPSPVSENKYDEIVDLEDVSITDNHGNKITRYQIVRGRLSDKHVIIISKDGNKKETDSSFDLEMGKVTKQAVN